MTSVTPPPPVLPAPPARVALFYLLLLLALLAAVLEGMWLFSQYQKLSAAMLERGYLSTVSWKANFALGCLIAQKCRSALWQAMVYGVPLWQLSAPLAVLLLAGLCRPTPQVRRKMPASGMWATPRSLRPYLEDLPAPRPGEVRYGYVGCVVVRGKLQMLRPPLDAKCAHLWIVAGTGGGKSSRLIKPLHVIAALEGSSCITLDIKYPDLKSGLMECLIPFEATGKKILIFTPFEPHSERLDLLAGVDSMFSAMLLAEALIPVSIDPKIEFWRRSARTLLKAMIYAARSGVHFESLSDLYGVVRRGPGAISTYLRERSDEAFEECRNKFDQPAGQLATLMENLAEALEVFAHPHVARATSAPRGAGLEVADILTSPGMLYIGINQLNVQSSWGENLIKVLIRYLHMRIDAVSAAHGGRLPIHVNFNLDEWGNMPALPFISQRLALMRSHNVCYNLSLQNATQGKVIYGELGFQGGTDNNVTHRIYLPGSLKDSRSREELALDIGKATYLDQGKSVSRPTDLIALSGARAGESEREVERPLLSVEEMLTQPPHRAVTFVASGPPAFTVLPRLDEPQVTVGGRSYANPLYALHLSFYAHIDVAATLQRLVRLRAPETFSAPLPLTVLTTDAPLLSSAAQAGLAAQLQPNPAEAERMSPPKAEVRATPGTHLAALQGWLDHLLDQGVGVQYFDSGGKQRIFVSRALAGPHTPPGALERLEAARLVKLEAEKITLTAAGRAGVSGALLLRVRACRYQDMVRKLLEEHAGRVDGLSGVSVPGADLILQDQVLLLNKDVVAPRLFGGKIPEHLQECRMHNKRFVALPLDPLALLEAFEDSHAPLTLNLEKT